MSNVFLDRIEAVLTGLPTDAPLHDVYDALSDFAEEDVAAVLATRSLTAGGGGGSLPDEWTQNDTPDPNTVHAGAPVVFEADHSSTDVVAVTIRKPAGGGGDFVALELIGADAAKFLQIYNTALWFGAEGANEAQALLYFNDSESGFPRSWFSGPPPEVGAQDAFGTITGAGFARLALSFAESSGSIISNRVGANFNVYTLEFVDPGAPDIPLSVSFIDPDLVVTLATDGGSVITSLLSEVAQAVADDVGAADAMTMEVGGDGLAEELAQTPLAGGVDAQVTWGTKHDGSEFLNSVGEPDDSDVETSQRVQWFDDATGAAKLRIKQRDDMGTLTERISAALTSDATAFAGVEKVSITVGDAAEILAALVTLGLVTDDT
jgi:hypothetical protein